jgi:hypothetical protein
MRIFSYILVLLIATTPLQAIAQQMALAPNTVDCPYQDPDSLQISWTQPCEEGTWLLDTQAGCRMWDWHPDPHDRAVWSGTCPAGKKDGHGIVQWFEHGQRIDRFEGTYRNDHREGFGRYDWNESDSFQGQYANDIPQGFGTAHIAGEVFAGDWRNGCLRKGDHVVAIGVPRTSCVDGQSVALKSTQSASF